MPFRATDRIASIEGKPVNTLFRVLIKAAVNSRVEPIDPKTGDPIGETFLVPTRSLCDFRTGTEFQLVELAQLLGNQPTETPVTKTAPSTIRITQEVWNELQRRAGGEKLTPDQILRRVLGLEASDDNLELAVELQDIATAPFHHLPNRTRQTQRHLKTADFIGLTKAANALLHPRFPGKLYDGSISWLGSNADSERLRGTADLTLWKLTYHGQEAEGADMAFGVRIAYVEAMPDVLKSTLFDRRFFCPPNYRVEFVGFGVRNEEASQNRIAELVRLVLKGLES